MWQLLVTIKRVTITKFAAEQGIHRCTNGSFAKLCPLASVLQAASSPGIHEAKRGAAAEIAKRLQAGRHLLPDKFRVSI